MLEETGNQAWMEGRKSLRLGTSKHSTQADVRDTKAGQASASGQLLCTEHVGSPSSVSAEVRDALTNSRCDVASSPSRRSVLKAMMAFLREKSQELFQFRLTTVTNTRRAADESKASTSNAGTVSGCHFDAQWRPELV